MKGKHENGGVVQEVWKERSEEGGSEWGWEGKGVRRAGIQATGDAVWCGPIKPQGTRVVNRVR